MLLNRWSSCLSPTTFTETLNGNTFVITIELPTDANSTQYVMVRNIVHNLTSEDKEKYIGAFPKIDYFCSLDLEDLAEINRASLCKDF